jgi:hypothetical protein
MSRRFLSTALCLTLGWIPAQPLPAASAVKLRGYITSRPDAQTLQILADNIHLESSTRFEIQNAGSGIGALRLEDLAPGILIEAEGRWTDRHQFTAEKISCDASQFDRRIKEHAYLQWEPTAENVLAPGRNERLEVDGEILSLAEKTQADWNNQILGVSAVSQKQGSPSPLVGRQVRYEGVRKSDGTIEAEHIELGRRVALKLLSAHGAASRPSPPTRCRRRC